MSCDNLWDEFGDHQMSTLSRIAADVLAKWPDTDDTKPYVTQSINKTLYDSVYRDPIIFSACVQDMARRINRIKSIKTYPEIEFILQQGFKELCVNSKNYSRATRQNNV
jgi:hypothetical protein